MPELRSTQAGNAASFGAQQPVASQLAREIAWELRRLEQDAPMIDLPHLLNIVVNSARYSDMIYGFMNELLFGDNPNIKLEGRGTRAKAKTSMRFAATMRDSLSQVALLLQGEDLDEVQLEDHDVPAFDSEELKLAEVYRMIKKAMQLHGDDIPPDELQDVLNFIARG